MTASQKFEEEARRWEETDEIASRTNLGVAILRLWIPSGGALQDGVSDRLQRYHQAAEEQIERQLGEDWYDDLLRIRSSCSICGGRYRLENLGFCTHCDALIGYCHQFDGGTAPNGNLKCPSCEDGETVG